jgi:D-glycero-D-manno-heptose 1,7-bisphosphate phosphatase
MPIDSLNGRPAAFLDRDGTLIVDHGYVGRPEQVQLLPGVLDGLRRLTDAGYALVV